MNKTLDVFHTIQCPVEVATSRVRDLLVSAFEGGSNYWIDSIDWELADGLSYEDFKEGGKLALDEYFPGYILVPFHHGCCLKIEVDESEDGNPKIYRLNTAAMKRGLEMMAKEQNNAHWHDFINENDDATTADVFLQLCLFGEVVFG